MLNLYILSLMASAYADAPPQPTAAELLAHWRNAMYTDQEHSRFRLSLVDPGADPNVRTAEVWYKSKGESDARILIKFLSPAAIRGVSFLSLHTKEGGGSDQWLYFPAYKRARRLSSHSRDEAFLDSDFTNGDISFEYENAFDFRVIGTADVAGKEAYRVEGKVKPSKAEGLAYSREVLFISKADFLNLRTEFYDKQNLLVKTLAVDIWKKYKNRWTADKITVENQKTRHRSVLEFTSRDLLEEPADRLFTLSHLESGR